MTALRIELGDWTALRCWAEPIRTQVFVGEQKVPADLEIDAHDPLSLHAVAFDGARAVGTGRLLPDGHIGRMAVLAEARGNGVGSALLTTLMAQARARGHATAVLSAQTHAVAFYRRHGYAVVGDEYLDCGIAHVDMRCAL
jgi:predicted GNAT family N-acyltransferase